MLSIKVLGPGCANCKRLEQITRRVIDEMQVDAVIEKITDYGDIMAFGVLSTPGLVLNERVLSSGRIPAKEEVAAWLESALAEA